MYEDLIKQLRDDEAWKNCDFDFIYGWMHEAADAIEELQKAVYFHKYNSEFWEDKYNSLADEKWIPVTERLPDIGTYIIAGKMKYSFEENYEHFVDVASYGFWDDKKKESWLTFNDWYEGQQEYEITHWTPLPEPPKEESNGV